MRHYACDLYPALKLAQHELADDVHAGIAVVKAGNRGKLLAAIMLEDLGVFLRDLLQRLQAIGGEAGGDDGDALHTIFREFLDGLVRIGLQPRVEAEARLKCKDQLGGIKAHPLAKRVRCCNALRLIGIALVDIFLRHAVKRRHDQLGLKRQGRQMRVDRDGERVDVIGIVVIRRRSPAASAARASRRARETPRRRRLPRSRRNIADRAAPPAGGRSPARSAHRCASGSTGCRSASPNRPRRGHDRKSPPRAFRPARA